MGSWQWLGCDSFGHIQSDSEKPAFLFEPRIYRFGSSLFEIQKRLSVLLLWTAVGVRINLQNSFDHLSGRGASKQYRIPSKVTWVYWHTNRVRSNHTVWQSSYCTDGHHSVHRQWPGAWPRRYVCESGAAVRSPVLGWPSWSIDWNVRFCRRFVQGSDQPCVLVDFESLPLCWWGGDSRCFTLLMTPRRTAVYSLVAGEASGAWSYLSDFSLSSITPLVVGLDDVPHEGSTPPFCQYRQQVESIFVIVYWQAGWFTDRDPVCSFLNDFNDVAHDAPVHCLYTRSTELYHDAYKSTGSASNSIERSLPPDRTLLTAIVRCIHLETEYKAVFAHVVQRDFIGDVAIFFGHCKEEVQQSSDSFSTCPVTPWYLVTTACTAVLNSWDNISAFPSSILDIRPP